jgi:hypothetical protein
MFSFCNCRLGQNVTANPVFQDWTAKAVEHRFLEATETLMLCPRVKGPKAFGSSMPEPLREQMDAYTSNASRYRRKPDAAAIDRMEECWIWVNTLPDPQDRRLLYDWGRAKCSQGRSLKMLAKREEFSDRTLRREITRIFMAIARRLNLVHQPNLNSTEVADAKPASEPTDKVSYQQHWRACNARPRIDPEQQKSRLI